MRGYPHNVFVFSDPIEPEVVATGAEAPPPSYGLEYPDPATGFVIRIYYTSRIARLLAMKTILETTDWFPDAERVWKLPSMLQSPGCEFGLTRGKPIG